MYRHIPLVALSLFSSLFLAACGNGTPPPRRVRRSSSSPSRRGR